MRPGILTLTTLLITATFAGCFEDPESKAAAPGTTSTGAGNETAEPGLNESANTPPTAGLTANLTEAAAPVLVGFNLTGVDAEGDNLTWSLDFGDNGTANGTALPATAEHVFSTAGNFTIVLTVSDGEHTTNASITVNVTAAVPSGPPAPMKFTGTLTTGEPNGVHKFSLDAPVESIKVVLTWGPVQGLGDLDLDVIAPNKKEKGAAAFNTPVATPLTSTGEQVTITEEELVSQTGEWTISVIPFACAEASYTATVTFT